MSVVVDPEPRIDGGCASASMLRWSSIWNPCGSWLAAPSPGFCRLGSYRGELLMRMPCHRLRPSDWLLASDWQRVSELLASSLYAMSGLECCGEQLWLGSRSWAQRVGLSSCGSGDPSRYLFRPWDELLLDACSCTRGESVAALAWGPSCEGSSTWSWWPLGGGAVLCAATVAVLQSSRGVVWLCAAAAAERPTDWSSPSAPAGP